MTSRISITIIRNRVYIITKKILSQFIKKILTAKQNIMNPN